MTDYTPTTEDIRDIYMGWVPYSQQRGMEEFYRWLAAHDAEVRADEREKAAQRTKAAVTEWLDGIPIDAQEQCIIDAARGDDTAAFRVNQLIVAETLAIRAAARGDGISDNPRPADSIGGEQA